MERTGTIIETPRLVLEPWHVDRADDALAIFGDPEVSRWLSPAMDPVSDVDAMRATIERWLDEDLEDDPPVGHWRATIREDGTAAGAVTLRRMPPYREDVELAWQFAPKFWHHGYATESAYALAGWAFSQGADELFAVTRPHNERAIRLANRLGMQWVGETEKYYDLRLQVFRVRPTELIVPVSIPDQR